MHHKKIELPAKIGLGCFGLLGGTWSAIDILNQEIEQRESKESIPFYRLKFSPYKNLSGDFLACYQSKPSLEYGRTKLYADKVAIKMQKEREHRSCLTRELEMQQALMLEKGLKSKIPTPIGTGVDTSTQKHYAAFEAPHGYYHYLSDISDEEQFIEAAISCAHDLGYLLKKGYVFQNLISVFHGEGRPYTLFPSLSKSGTVGFMGFPGKIEKIIGLKLYENLGASGLRDLGDMEFIDDFKFSDRDHLRVDAMRSLKTAHFI